MRRSEIIRGEVRKDASGRVYGEDEYRVAVLLKNVTTAYPRSKDPALKNVSISIKKGSLSLVTGPNGAGKTTLLELILGFLRPLSGTVRVLGLEMPKHARKVRLMSSYLMQDFMKPPTETYTVKQVVSMGLAAFKGPVRPLSEREKELIKRAIKMVGLEGLEEKPIGILSGGQQQRAFLARVIVRQPKLILLDEPFSSLDREGRMEISMLINDIRKHLNSTVIVVSHDISPIIDYVDKVIEMKDGCVVSENDLHDSSIY